jgi:hydroxyethylthiazole kinase-like uncharacterized protein yjeF
MKILSADQVKKAEAAFMSNENISSLALMEQASMAFVNWYVKKFDQTRSVYVFCGPGNNGGDGMVIARLLFHLSYSIQAFVVHSEKYTPELLENRRLLEKLLPVQSIASASGFPVMPPGSIIVDALFGIGINKPLTGLSAALVTFLNTSRGEIISVDIASGLFPDHTSKGATIIQPAFTIAFQIPKLGFMFPENSKYVGHLEVIDIRLSKELISRAPSSHFYSDTEAIMPILKEREQYSHKGNYGKALIIAGSYGMTGAAVLAVKACYRAGAGLVRGYIPACGYAILQTVVPEAMALTDPSFHSITDIPDIVPYNAIAIGPGINENAEGYQALKKLLTIAAVPLVIDAGALNILSKHRDLLQYLPQNSILTPHLGEFQRLTQVFANDFDKLEGLRQFSKQLMCIVILKGAHTAIALPDGKIYFNSTGNPGMATGGSGDVLTGIITGLMAQSYTPEESAILGVFLHGFAGDIAAKRRSQQSLLAGDIIDAIGDFYKEMFEAK